MKLVTRFLPSTVTEKNATKNILDRGKTVYPPPPSGSGGIIITLLLTHHYLAEMLLKLAFNTNQ
jgi:hypothetical protein